jgi:signal transduction histidine kinase
MAFGSDSPIDLQDERLRLHLEAVFDQVDLLVRVHLLHRELALAHEGLVQTEKLGVVGALAAATAHDIRNIMSAIDIELASTGRDADLTLQSVRQQTARFSVLAHRLLSYAKPHPGVRATIHLKDVLDSVMSLLEAHFRISDVLVKVCLPGNCQVRGDAGQLEHVFINLFLNSMQAMPAGGEISVKAVHGKDALLVSVSDTGPGILNGPELFQPFSTSRANGFGMGLYSCQRIIEEHAGTISVESATSAGTTFLITLPNGCRS